MSKLMEEAISTNPVIVEEMKMIEEPRKSPNTSDGCCYQQRRTPLKDICNEPRAKKTCLLFTGTTPKTYDCCYDGTTAWAPVICQTTPVVVSYAASSQFDSNAVRDNTDNTSFFGTARGILDAITIEPSESADSFFANTAGKTPPESAGVSPSAARDIKASTISCTGDIAQAASSMLALTSGVKRWARWTAEEDQLLQSSVAIEGIENWMLISAKYFNGSRNEIQIKNRWKKILQPGLENDEKWSEAEDAIISECVVKKGTKNWSDIALLLPGKTSDEIKERYENALDTTFKKSTKWTDEEYRILREQHAKHGNCWKTIASKLHGRTERNVKNKWYNMKTSEKRAAAAEAAHSKT